MSQWKSHPVIPGILCRVVTPEQAAEERRAEEEAEEKRVERLSRRWLRPIPPDLSWPYLERLAARSWFGLGGSICDQPWRHDTTIMVGSKRVAAAQLVLYIQFEVEGGQDVSDAITVTVYRNPTSPRRLLLTTGKDL